MPKSTKNASTGSRALGKYHGYEIFVRKGPYGFYFYAKKDGRFVKGKTAAYKGPKQFLSRFTLSDTAYFKNILEGPPKVAKIRKSYETIYTGNVNGVTYQLNNNTKFDPESRAYVPTTNFFITRVQGGHKAHKQVTTNLLFYKAECSELLSVEHLCAYLFGDFNVECYQAECCKSLLPGFTNCTNKSIPGMENYLSCYC